MKAEPALYFFNCYICGREESRRTNTEYYFFCSQECENTFCLSEGHHGNYEEQNSNQEGINIIGGPCITIKQ